MKYIASIILMSLLWVSCVDDDTSLGGKPISEISISGVDEAYNLEKGDILKVSPVVSQSIASKELFYTWEINQEVYSHERDLSFDCEELGSFNARLIVENEDGKEFFPFKINVNSPYEEGILIISNGDNGESRVSFMRNNPDGSGFSSFVAEDCFALNNPDVNFSSYVSDVTQSNGSVIMCCKGDGTAQNPSMIYYLNDKTFDLENVVNTSEYPDFKPLRMHVCTKGIGGAAYPILSENGEVYEFASTEGTIIKSTKRLPYIYNRSTAFFDSGTGYQFNIIFWDEELSVPLEIMTGYGPFYCVTNYADVRYRERVNSSNNMFEGYELVQVLMPRLTLAQSLTQVPDLYFITVNKNTGMLHRTVITTGFWITDYTDYSVSMGLKEQLKIIGFGTYSALQPESPVIVSGLHKAAYIGGGNKLFRWYLSTSMPTISSAPFATVGNASTVITSIEMSKDQKQLYVAAYDTAQSGLNGSLYILDIETGELLSQYLNVAYKPVKIIYKTK